MITDDDKSCSSCIYDDSDEDCIKCAKKGYHYSMSGCSEYRSFWEGVRKDECSNNNV